MLNHIFMCSSKENEERIEPSIEKKILNHLIQYVYKQSLFGLVTSLCCAVIVFSITFNTYKKNEALYIWSVFFALTNLWRLYLVIEYIKSDGSKRGADLWKRDYLISCALAGVCWGMPALILFPHLDIMHQLFIVLILAGVTGGSISLMSPIYSASVIFLVLTITPYIAIVFYLKYPLFYLLDLALSIYLGYVLILSKQASTILVNSFTLKCKNEALLLDVSLAKAELELINKKLQDSASHDPLMQVANRRLFQSQLNNALESAKKNKKQLALFYMDIDHFKKINDQYGHFVGDQILLIIAKRLRRFLRTSDRIARLGGDEISVILENINSINDVIAVAEKVCALVAIPIRIDELILNTSVSIGISLYPDDAKDTESLIRFADKLMYSSKRQGGNRFCLAQELIIS